MTVFTQSRLTPMVLLAISNVFMTFACIVGAVAFTFMPKKQAAQRDGHWVGERGRSTKSGRYARSSACLAC